MYSDRVLITWAQAKSEVLPEFLSQIMEQSQNYQRAKAEQGAR